MKQKLICIVLVLACMHMPSPSKECGKVAVACSETEQVKAEEPAADTEEIGSLPASPLTKCFVNL